MFCLPFGHPYYPLSPPLPSLCPLSTRLPRFPRSHPLPLHAFPSPFALSLSTHSTRCPFDPLPPPPPLPSLPIRRPFKVEQLARNYLRNPAYIAIGDRHMKAVDRITQVVEFCKDNEKFAKLLAILAHEEPPIMVFCNAKNACDSLRCVRRRHGGLRGSQSAAAMQERVFAKIMASVFHHTLEYKRYFFILHQEKSAKIFCVSPC
jgi:hypothetical protein